MGDLMGVGKFHWETDGRTPNGKVFIGKLAAKTPMENIASLGNRWPKPQWKIFCGQRGQAE
jgi:hypothetical protein